MRGGAVPVAAVPVAAMLVAAMLVAALPGGPASSEAARVSDFTLERQERFRRIEGALTALEVLASGALPYDPARGAALAADMAEAAGGLADAFGDTPLSRFGATVRARQEVWTDPAPFLAGVADLEARTFALIAVARAGDRAALLPALAELRATCASCHARYLRP